MRTVYEAANALEAHMIAGMLGQLGIEAHVAGEHLQSAAGEVPMAGLVRLLVDDADVERARQIIADWEQAQPPTVPAAVALAAARPRMPWGPVLVAFLAGTTLAGFLLSREESSVIDYNGDGVADEEHVFVQDVLRRIEHDRNHDGRPDEIAHFDRQGYIVRVESDHDFNGVFEGETRYSGGQAVAWTQDHDQDGRIDGRGTIPTPAVEYVDILDLETGLPARRYRWCMGRLQAELVDTDRDGRLDTANLHTQRGDIGHSSRDLDAAMKLDCPWKPR